MDLIGGEYNSTGETMSFIKMKLREHKERKRKIDNRNILIGFCIFILILLIYLWAR
jgi:hypothetical protein